MYSLPRFVLCYLLLFLFELVWSLLTCSLLLLSIFAGTVSFWLFCTIPWWTVIIFTAFVPLYSRCRSFASKLAYMELGRGQSLFNSGKIVSNFSSSYSSCEHTFLELNTVNLCSCPNSMYAFFEAIDLQLDYSASSLFLILVPSCLSHLVIAPPVLYHVCYMLNLSPSLLLPATFGPCYASPAPRQFLVSVFFTVPWWTVVSFHCYRFLRLFTVIHLLPALYITSKSLLQKIERVIFWIFFMYAIHHCHRSDSTVLEDAGIETRTVATSVVDPGWSGSDFLPIPNNGSRGQKGTGSGYRIRIRIRNTDYNLGIDSQML